MDFIEKNYKESLETQKIDSNLYDVYNVKRGLRNSNGTGVLIGLTKISDVKGYKFEDGKKIDTEGHLYYRGVDLYDFAKKDKDVFGYEKTCFLLLFGRLPNDDEFEEFRQIIASNYQLPKGFLEDIMLKTPSKNLMNHIARAILALYAYDDNPDDQDPLLTLRKGISLVAKMPAIISYSLQAKTHYLDNDALHIHFPKKELSIAENILYLSRNDGAYTELEAEMLDLALIIHADHGGGNNSTFANVVVCSTGTDLYSAMAASLGSLKGPKHGGANKAVLDMMNYILNDITVDATDDEIKNIINKLLNKEYYDHTGLIYGIGHAVYTISDPRCNLLRSKCEELSKGNPVYEKKLDFYKRFEKFSIEELKRRKNANYCANVDFYSGLAYGMLNIPEDLFTPIFACARLVGWLAHNIEEKLYSNKILRPATKYVGEIFESNK